MRILTDIELRRNYKEVKGVTSPLDTTESLNVSEIAEKGGKFVYKTKDGEKEIKVDAGLGKVVLALSKEDWVDNGQGKFTYTITPDMLNLAPSVTYGIEMQVFNFNIMMWQRVAVTPNITQEGNIIITSLSRLECNIIVTSGLILPPPKPNPTKIYGVTGINRTKTLTRTDDAVGLGYTTEVVPATSPFLSTYQVTKYTSDFDNEAIYKDITEVVVGDNTFIKIPKFYHKYTLESNGSYKLQIANVKVDETWDTLFINKGKELPYVYIGKYQSTIRGNDPRLLSKSRMNTSDPTPDINKTAPEIVAAARANGKGYHIFDYLEREIIKLLFLVEFATTRERDLFDVEGVDSQKSYTFSQVGSTDTQSPNNVTCYIAPENNRKIDYKAFKYRGVENPWGNTRSLNYYSKPYGQLLEGVLFNRDSSGKDCFYISTSVEEYSLTEVNSSYKKISDVKTTSYVKNLGVYKGETKELPKLLIPNNGTPYSDNLYNTETVNISAQTPTGFGTVHEAINGEIGLFDLGYSYSDTKISTARLCYKPIDEV